LSTTRGGAIVAYRTEAWMRKIYRLLLALFARRMPEDDPLATFTARDWADLPPYHPLK
jgi:hypothetical protein